jgi:Protein of unknown function (DUF559)
MGGRSTSPSAARAIAVALGSTFTVPARWTRATPSASTAFRARRPARAILEIAPQLPDRRLKRLVRKAQAEKLATVRQFEAMLGRASGHPGARRIAAIIATGAAPTYSGDEDAVLDLLLGEGFEHPQVNQRLIVGAATERSPYFPDMRWPRQQLILEIDSAWHDDPLSQQLDAERQAELEAVGERVLRTTKEQALADPRQLFARLTAAGARCEARTAPYTHPQP